MEFLTNASPPLATLTGTCGSHSNQCFCLDCHHHHHPSPTSPQPLLYQTHSLVVIPWVKERKEINKQISINTGSVSSSATKLKKKKLYFNYLEELKNKTPLPILNHIDIWPLICDVMGTSKFQFLFMCLKTIIYILCEYMIFKFGFAFKSSPGSFFFFFSWERAGPQSSSLQTHFQHFPVSGWLSWANTSHMPCHFMSIMTLAGCVWKGKMLGLGTKWPCLRITSASYQENKGWALWVVPFHTWKRNNCSSSPS